MHSQRHQQHSSGNLTSLLRCIQENNPKRLEKLLGMRASLHITHHDLSYCMCEAINQGKTDCVPPLLAVGADPNWITEDGRCPLHILVDQGADPLTIKVLVQAGSNPNSTAGPLHQTPLHIAAKRGHQVCIRILIGGGARVNKTDAQGNTPLILASKEGHLTTVTMLLRENADPNLGNLQHETALHFAASASNVDCIHELMSQGASPNVRDDLGQTPLFVACKAGQLRVVEALLDYQCDVNAQNTSSGKTVLHWAVQTGDVRLVQVLLQRGAEANVRDNEWETPFMTALNSGRIDIIRLLIQAGCRVTVTDRSFNTALHVAARDGHEELVPILVKAGLEVNLKGAGGLTPLMLGCLGGHTAIVKTLLGLGANPDMLDRHRASALVCAIISDCDDSKVNAIMKLLIRANCSVDCRANVLNFMKSLNMKMGKQFKLLDQLYSPLELAFFKCRIVPFMLLLQAGCKLRHLDLNSIMAYSSQESLKGPDLKMSQYLLKCFCREKYDIRPLKEMCRKHALTALGGNVSSQVICNLPVDDKIKRFLLFEDLDHLEQSFNIAFKDRRIGSEPTKLEPIKESIQASSFQRQDKRRQTYHGRRSAPATTPTKPDAQTRFRKSPQPASPRSNTPTSPLGPLSPSPSPGLASPSTASPFKRALSLRIPKSHDTRKYSSIQNFNSGVTSPSSSVSSWSSRSSPRSPPGLQNGMNGHMVPTAELLPSLPRSKRLGSPDTGYSSTCSSLADWSAHNGALHNNISKEKETPEKTLHTIKTCPAGLSKWSTQDDVNSLMNSDESSCIKPMRSPSTSSFADEAGRSRIPVFQKNMVSPKALISHKDDMAARRLPTSQQNGSNFIRSRSFRKW